MNKQKTKGFVKVEKSVGNVHTNCRIKDRFFLFQGFYVEQSLYRSGFVECNIAADISEQNKDISNSASRKSCRTSINY